MGQEDIPDRKQWPPFPVADSTVLISGGSSGIGLALAKQFQAAGAKVLIVGRSKDKLEQAAKDLPGLVFYVNDVSDFKQREELHRRVVDEHPEVNVLVNNAGNQRRVSLPDDTNWPERAAEIELNLSAPIHLAWLFTPHFQKQKEAAIINMTSSLGTEYSAVREFSIHLSCPREQATKAALASWTVSARYSYVDTNIRLVEIIPPSVKSNLGGSHGWGVETDEFAQGVFKHFAEGKIEIGYEKTTNLPVWVEDSADRQAIRKIGPTAASIQEFKKY